VSANNCRCLCGAEWPIRARRSLARSATPPRARWHNRWADHRLLTTNRPMWRRAVRRPDPCRGVNDHHATVELCLAWTIWVLVGGASHSWVVICSGLYAHETKSALTFSNLALSCPFCQAFLFNDLTHTAQRPALTGLSNTLPTRHLAAMLVGSVLR